VKLALAEFACRRQNFNEKCNVPVWSGSVSCTADVTMDIQKSIIELGIQWWTSGYPSSLGVLGVPTQIWLPISETNSVNHNLILSMRWRRVMTFCDIVLYVVFGVLKRYFSLCYSTVISLSLTATAISLSDSSLNYLNKTCFSGFTHAWVCRNT